MTRLVLSPKAVDDIERLSDFLLASDPSTASKTGGILESGLQVLKEHPLIGRQVERGFRELLISRGRTGYVALYKFDVVKDVAIVLAIRHQRESSFNPR
jgi:plasmid stabilization system protein ParE